MSFGQLTARHGIACKVESYLGLGVLFFFFSRRGLTGTPRPTVDHPWSVEPTSTLGHRMDLTATSNREDAVQQRWRAANPLGWQWFLTPFFCARRVLRRR